MAKYSVIGIFHTLFIYSSVDEDLGCFHSWLLQIILLCMDMLVQIFVWKFVFSSPGYIPRIGIAGSYSSSIFTLLRNCQTSFHSTCAISQSHQQCTRVPVFHIFTNPCCLFSFIFERHFHCGWNYRLTIFSFSTLIMLFHFLLAFIVSSEKSAVILFFPLFLHTQCVLPLLLLLRFSLYH